MKYPEAIELLWQRVHPVEFADMLYQELEGDCADCQLSRVGFEHIMEYIAGRISQDRDAEETREET